MMPPLPAFKIDENLPRSATATLTSLGFDAVSALDQGLQGAPDTTLVDVCRRESRALVTLDLDFADIRTYPPAENAGIVVLRLGRQDPGSIAACLHHMSALLRTEAVMGRLWIVDESTVRIREG